MHEQACPTGSRWRIRLARRVTREAEEDWGLLGPSARSWSSLHSGELLSRPRYPGQTHFRAVHGDQELLCVLQPLKLCRFCPGDHYAEDKSIRDDR